MAVYCDSGIAPAIIIASKGFRKTIERKYDQSHLRKKKLNYTIKMSKQYVVISAYF